MSRVIKNFKENACKRNRLCYNIRCMGSASFHDLVVNPITKAPITTATGSFRFLPNYLKKRCKKSIFENLL